MSVMWVLPFFNLAHFLCFLSSHVSVYLSVYLYISIYVSMYMYLSIAATSDVVAICIFAYDDVAFAAADFVVVVANVTTNLVDAAYGVVVADVVVATVTVDVDALVI